MNLVQHKIRIALLASMMFACSYSSASPYQFVAKVYTEGFGRSPEPIAWTYFTGYIAQYGCNSTTLKGIVKTIYTSAEFNQLGYSNEAKVIAAYRGALNREPDEDGFRKYLRLLDRRNYQVSNLIDDLTASAEFSALVATICNAPLSYGWGTTPALAKVPKDQGATGVAPKDDVALQRLLERAKNTPSKTVTLKKRHVVEASKNIIVPENVTLTTEGNPDRKHYADMARIVRTSSSLTGPLITLKVGASLNSVWVSGQRSIYGYVPISSGSGSLVACESCGSVQNNRLENTYGWTTLAPMMTNTPTMTDKDACNAIISANLITGYSNTHSMFVNGKVTTDFSDGISNSCGNATISGNEIIDASDIAIAVFEAVNPYYPNLAQVSQVFGNTIISAGVPTNAAFLFEAKSSSSFSNGSKFATISGNTFWAAPDSHFDIGLALGGASYMQYALPYPVGSFPVIKNNTNAGIPTPMGDGIVIEYMQNVTVTGNTLTVQVPSATAGGYTFRCPTGNASNIYFDTSNSSGNVEGCSSMALCSIPSSPQFVPFVDRCTGHCWINNTICN